MSRIALTRIVLSRIVSVTNCLCHELSVANCPVTNCPVTDCLYSVRMNLSDLSHRLMSYMGSSEHISRKILAIWLTTKALDTTVISTQWCKLYFPRLTT